MGLGKPYQEELTRAPYQHLTIKFKQHNPEKRACDGRLEDSSGHWVHKNLLTRDDSDSAKFLEYVTTVPEARPPNCLICPSDVEPERFVRNGTCERPSTLDLVRLILSNADRVILLGDSMLDQIYKGVRWSSKLIGEKDRMDRVLECHLWLCIPENHDLLHNAFLSYGIIRKGIPATRVNDILVLSFGNWYKWEAGTCPCRPEEYEDPETEQHLQGCRSQEYFDYSEEWLFCNTQRINPKKRFGWTECSEVRRHACHLRRLNGLLTVCSWRRDMVRLARYLRDNREHLPRHVLYIETCPTHKKKVDTPFVTGHWRNEIAKKILNKFTNNITFIHVHNTLRDRWDSHCTRDSFHWCYHSGAYEEFLGSVLSAVAARVVPGFA